MEDLLSLLPKMDKADSYPDFLNHIRSLAKYDKVDTENINITYYENLFLNDDWLPNFIYHIFGKLAGQYLNFIFKKRESRKKPRALASFFYFIGSFFIVKQSNIFQTNNSTTDILYKPYLILYALGLDEDWFLYGPNSINFFGNERTQTFCRFLRQQLKIGHGKRKITDKTLSMDQLHPVMTLLIVLRREWEYSMTGAYISYKSNSLKQTDKLNDALIYGLYQKFDHADTAIIQEFATKVPPIEFHRLVAMHLIEYGFYKDLFINKYMENSGEMTVPKRELYESAEEKLNLDNFKGTRLLLDYLFPFTEVRDNDVFLPTDIINRIYISLIKGKDYKRYWRKPEDRERFDIVQIEQPIKKDEYNHSQVIGYQGHLKPGGKFFVVKSKKDYELEDKLQEIFSNFRHDLLKTLLSPAIIENLQNNLDLFDKTHKKITSLLNEIESFTNLNDNNDHLASLRRILSDLDNDDDLKKISSPKIAKLSDIIVKIRYDVEKSCDSNLQEFDASISNNTSQLKQLWAEICIEIFLKQKDRIDRIIERHKILSNYIEMAGIEKPELKNKKSIKIVEFLENYKRLIGLNTGNIYVSIDVTNIEKDYTIFFNEAILHIILDSIVDNAITHGFTGYNCVPRPTIKFALVDKGDSLLLKICNNGRPIDITIEDYKARGVHAGPTGHTGLGGYQINRYAESQGGSIELHSTNQWNTEIHLKLPKNNIYGE